MLTLEQYPATIAQIQRQILDLEKQTRRYLETLALLDNGIDREVSEDSDLKNDTQRKARRDQLRLLSPDRASTIDRMNWLTDRRREQEIDLEYYRSEYKLLVLQLREKVARIESSAA